MKFFIKDFFCKSDQIRGKLCPTYRIFLQNRSDYRIGVLKNFAKFLKTTSAILSFIWYSCRPRPATYQKVGLHYWCFPANFMKILKTTVLFYILFCLETIVNIIFISSYHPFGRGRKKASSKMFDTVLNTLLRMAALKIL